MPVPSFEHQRRYSVTRLSSGYTSAGMDNQFSYDPSASTNTRIALPTLPTFMATPHAPAGPSSSQSAPRRRSLRVLEATPSLFNEYSRFPSLALPPLGSRANNADVEDPEDIFNDGTTVFVRRLQADAQRVFWSEWRQGTIVRYQPLRHYLGCSAHAYVVAIPRERGPSMHAVFTRYLGEICLPREMPRIARLFDLHSCLQKQRQLNLVFVRCDLDKTADVCTPAEIVGVTPNEVSSAELSFVVRPLAGPAAGTQLLVPSSFLLPYSWETVRAGRAQGLGFLGPDGHMLLSAPMSLGSGTFPQIQATPRPRPWGVGRCQELLAVADGAANPRPILGEADTSRAHATMQPEAMSCSTGSLDALEPPTSSERVGCASQAAGLSPAIHSRSGRSRNSARDVSGDASVQPHSPGVCGYTISDSLVPFASPSKLKRPRSPLRHDPHAANEEKSAKRCKSSPTPPRAKSRLSSAPSLQVRSLVLPVFGAKSRKLPGVSHKFLDFHLENLAYVDKTPYAFQLPERLRYLLLRPRRFGKSAFISLLRQCYDISIRPRFTQFFGESSASEHLHNVDNTHLCLDITFHPIMDPSLAAITEDIKFYIRSALWAFLHKYSPQLGEYEVPQILETKDPLGTVIDLVRAAGLSLFVNVDDFDALFWLPRHCFDSTTRASAPEINDLLDSLLWEPLLAGRDITPKFVVAAAVLPVATLAERLQLSAAPELDFVCGFALSEAEKLVSGFFDEPTVNLRDVCGAYIFSETSAEPLLHPQQVLALAKHLSQPEELPKPFTTLTTLISMLRQSSSSSDEVTRQDIVALVVSGAVTVPASPDAFVDGDLCRPTWHAFVGAGALMRDPRSPQTLRMSPVPSVLELLHSCIDETIAERLNLRWDLLGPWGEFNAFQPDRWVDLLQRALRGFSKDLRGRGHEPTLHGVFELILRNANTRKTHVIPPPPLVFKAPRGGDILKLPGYRKGTTISLELVTITLLELWRGENPNADAHTPDKDELEALYEKVLGEPEEVLLGRQYRAWSSELEAMESKLVESVVKADPAHIQLVAIGGAHVVYRGRREEVPELCGPPECDMGDFSGGKFH
uniref:AAA-ATPase-like domain-containing protein n=1 Tax=Mycena chlorophos TaxID=658473 RepID=A0ABQ0LKI9_MYCCL|nr:predicted protein [Mycena chlorophos]